MTTNELAASIVAQKNLITQSYTYASKSCNGDHLSGTASTLVSAKQLNFMLGLASRAEGRPANRASGHFALGADLSVQWFLEPIRNGAGSFRVLVEIKGDAMMEAAARA